MTTPGLPPKLNAIPPDLLSLADYAEKAGGFMTPAIRAWLEGGSGTQQALPGNRAVLDGMTLYNRILVDCRQGSTRTTLLGQMLHYPVLLAPLGYHRLVHPEGEIATARGALDTTLVVSTMASVPMEDIAGAAAGPLWFQLYFQPRREDTLALLRRAEAAGYRAVMITVDTPVQPLGLAAQKAGFSLPPDIRAANLEDRPAVSPPRLSAGDSAIFQGMMTIAPTWDDLHWLRDRTSLPLIVKGISHPHDAEQAVSAGMDGLALSSHGGRALEAAPPPLAALADIRKAIGSDVPVLVDGGIRTGTDVVKALALGADAVMIGRPQLHALAIAGSLGVAHMLQLLRQELEIAMALAGCPTIDAITPSAIFRPGEGSCCL